MARVLAFLAATSGLWALSSTALAADVVAERTLPRGVVITADDLSGNDDLAANFIGLETKRMVRVGTKVDERLFQTPRLVRRNDMVTLVFTSGRLRMETTGRSLGEGGAGDMVMVMNSNSRQRVTGRITGPGEVEVRK